MGGSIDASVLQLAYFLGLHAQNAYLTGLDLRRTLVQYDAVGLFQQDRGYLVASGDQLVIAFAGSRRAETTFGLVDWSDNLTARLEEPPVGGLSTFPLPDLDREPLRRFPRLVAPFEQQRTIERLEQRIETLERRLKELEGQRKQPSPEK